jgi:membrane associated rhomboid family serine protease
MILPIGHAETATRRLPWVTFAIMAICLLALLGTDTSQLDAGPTPDLLMQEATDYWRNHAYLEADSEIRSRVGYDVMPNQRTQYLALLADQGLATAPEDPESWLAEQETLDQLTDYGLGRAVSPEAAASDNPFRRWGLLPSEIGIVTLLTHIFMHAGWLHLLSNFFMLFLAGPAVEDRLGRPFFAGFYLAAGIFAALFWAFLAPDPNVPLVGASGAIAGVLGAFLIRFWSSNIRFAYFFMFGFKPYYGTFEAKAWLMLPLWLASEIFQGYLAHSLGIGSGVAYWAHVGGFLFGVTSVFAFRQLGIEEKFVNARIEQKVTVAAANTVVGEALELREQGEEQAALDKLREAFGQAPRDRDVALAFWDAALATEQPERAADAMKALIRLCVADGDGALAVGHWMELGRVLPGAFADPTTLVRLTKILIEEGDSELAARALREAVDPDNAPMTTGLALRTLELARQVDPPSALRAARRALESPDLVDGKRARVQAALDELLAEGVSEAPRIAVEEAALEAKAADREIELPDDEGAEVLVAAAAFAAPSQLPLPPPVPQPVPPPLPGPAVERPPPLETQALSLEGDLVAEPVSQEISIDPIEAIVAGPRFAGIKVVDAKPVALQENKLRLLVSDERRAKLEYETIEAVAVAAVRGMGPKPVLVIDLLLNWRSLEETPLRVIRLRSCDFDPCSVVPEADNSLSALKRLVDRLLEESGGVALPGPDAARGEPFEVFEELALYEREVLQVEG